MHPNLSVCAFLRTLVCGNVCHRCHVGKRICVPAPNQPKADSYYNEYIVSAATWFPCGYGRGHTYLYCTDGDAEIFTTHFGMCMSRQTIPLYSRCMRTASFWAKGVRGAGGAKARGGCRGLGLAGGLPRAGPHHHHRMMQGVGNQLGGSRAFTAGQDLIHFESHAYTFAKVGIRAPELLKSLTALNMSNATRIQRLVHPHFPSPRPPHCQQQHHHPVPKPLAPSHPCPPPLLLLSSPGSSPPGDPRAPRGLRLRRRGRDRQRQNASIPVASLAGSDHVSCQQPPAACHRGSAHPGAVPPGA